MKTTIIILSSAVLSNAAVLSGTGPALPIAGPHGTAPGIAHSTTVAAGTWTGTWSGAAPADWVGSFDVSGPTLGSGMSGTATYDFSTLPTATLPAGTYFLLGDVDSVVDTLDFRAWNSAGVLLDLWLDDTVATYGTGTGPGGTPAVINMPGWTWDPIGKSYNIDGGTTSGPNPSLGIVLQSNQDIATLEVIKPSFSYGFALRAPEPIPEPSAVLLTALASSLALLRRKRS